MAKAVSFPLRFNINKVVLGAEILLWRKSYGNDERLTEAYAPDLWTDY